MIHLVNNEEDDDVPERDFESEFRDEYGSDPADAVLSLFLRLNQRVNVLESRVREAHPLQARLSDVRDELVRLRVDMSSEE